MSNLLIHGGRRLSGRLTVEGNKNAALPLLAACLLTEDTCEIHNVPRIRDVAVMIELLRSLGAEVEGQGTPTLRVTCKRVTSSEPDPQLVGRLRGSVLLLGALVGRTGRAMIAPPGGDFPARRTITTHLRALRAMGARIVESSAGSQLETPGGLAGASMYLLEASVTGTETAMLAAAKASGVTEIRNAACEPHVAELSEFLRVDGRRRAGDWLVDDSHRGAGSLARRHAHAARRLHRGRLLGGRRRCDGRRGGNHRGRGRGSRADCRDSRPRWAWCSSSRTAASRSFRRCSSGRAGSRPACGPAFRATS